MDNHITTPAIKFEQKITLTAIIRERRELDGFLELRATFNTVDGVEHIVTIHSDGKESLGNILSRVLIEGDFNGH